MAVSPSSARFVNRLVQALVILFLLLVIGTSGYSMLEGFPVVDALYMTVITISTVGFGEIRPLSSVGRLFTIFLIIGGGGLAAFAVSTMVEFLVTGQWREYWIRRRKLRMLSSLDKHAIVCGFGRVGRHVSDELAAEGVPFVVLDIDPDRIEHAERKGYLAIQGNAANEKVLHDAGIAKARAMVAAVASDAENVFIVLTARSLNPNIYIVSRANYEDSEPKLLRAGANHTIQPYRISGKRMVTMLMRPNVADFLDEISHAGGLELLLEQVQIAPGSPLVGQTLQEAEIGSRLGVTVLACRSQDGVFHTPPGPGTVLKAHTSMIALGTREQLRALMQLANP